MQTYRSLLAAALLTSALALPVLAAPASADHQAATKLFASTRFKAAAATLAREHDRTVEDIIRITEIPAPPFKEATRGKAYAEMLEAHGLTEVETDSEGNVMGLRRGTGPAGGKLIVVSAHLDTVFPEGTPIKVRREGTRLHAPGIADDSRGLAVLLAWIRALDAAQIATQADILFVGTVGEEGAGDLRGVRHFFTAGKYKDRVAGFFSIDGLDAAGVTNGGTGSKRYRAIFRGPGGHSYGAFGIVNPMAAMARTITDLYAIQPPKEPKTTYSASVAGGGTSVNAIPDEAWIEIDMRSAEAGALADLDAKFKTIAANAVTAENAARSTGPGKVSVELKPIGDRPAGSTPADAPLVRSTMAAVAAAGLEPKLTTSSTDSNIAMSLGIPAVTIGSGGTGGRAHALDEYIDVEPAASIQGMTAGLAAVLLAAGVK